MKDKEPIIPSRKRSRKESSRERSPRPSLRKNSNRVSHLKKKSGRKSIKFTRKLWTKQEDEAITALSDKYGTKHWTLIAKKLREEFGIAGRSGKQCRERWHNHLNPSVLKSPISEKEEDELFQAYRVYGNKWAEIAKALPGRTDNVVKNHFYSTLRREIRKVLKQIYSSATPTEPEEVSIKYLHSLMKENCIAFSSVDNKNLVSLINEIDSSSSLSRPEVQPDLKYNFREKGRKLKLKESDSEILHEHSSARKVPRKVRSERKFHKPSIVEFGIISW